MGGEGGEASSCIDERPSGGRSSTCLARGSITGTRASNRGGKGTISCMFLSIVCHRLWLAAPAPPNDLGVPRGVWGGGIGTIGGVFFGFGVPLGIFKEDGANTGGGSVGSEGKSTSEGGLGEGGVGGASSCAGTDPPDGTSSTRLASVGFITDSKASSRRGDAGGEGKSLSRTASKSSSST